MPTSTPTWDEVRHLRELLAEADSDALLWQRRFEKLQLDTQPLLSERLYLLRERERNAKAASGSNADGRE